MCQYLILIYQGQLKSKVNKVRHLIRYVQMDIRVDDVIIATVSMCFHIAVNFYYTSLYNAETVCVIANR